MNTEFIKQKCKRSFPLRTHAQWEGCKWKLHWILTSQAGRTPNLDEIQCWQSCGETCVLRHCWWALKWSTSLGDPGSHPSVCQHHKCIPPFCPVIPLLGVCPSDTAAHVWNHTCTKSHMMALLPMAEHREQPCVWQRGRDEYIMVHLT